MNNVQLSHSEPSSFSSAVLGDSPIARGAPFAKIELSSTDSLVQSIFFIIFFPIIIPIVLFRMAVLISIRIMSIFIFQAALFLGITLMGTAAITAIIASQILPGLILVAGVGGICFIAFSMVANKILEDVIKPLPITPLLDFFTD